MFMLPFAETFFDTYVVVRTTPPISSSRGSRHVWTNTVRLAAVITNTMSARDIHGLQGSASGPRVIFKPPDPGVKTQDLIAVIPRRAGDPTSPAAGDVWVDETAGEVKWFHQGAVAVIGPVPGSTADVLTFDAPGETDVRTPVIYTVEGPATDAAVGSLLFRVQCAGQG